MISNVDWWQRHRSDFQSGSIFHHPVQPSGFGPALQGHMQASLSLLYPHWLVVEFLLLHQCFCCFAQSRLYSTQITWLPCIHLWSSLLPHQFCQCGVQICKWALFATVIMFPGRIAQMWGLWCMYNDMISKVLLLQMYHTHASTGSNWKRDRLCCWGPPVRVWQHPLLLANTQQSNAICKALGLCGSNQRWILLAVKHLSQKLFMNCNTLTGQKGKTHPKVHSLVFSVLCWSLSIIPCLRYTEARDTARWSLERDPCASSAMQQQAHL